MPSDARTPEVLHALADRVAAFRAALTAAHDEMRDHFAVDRGQAEAAARALGGFARGRIDAERFGALLADARPLPPEGAARITRCAAVLAELLACEEALFVCTVPPGEDLHRVVDAAFAGAGRAFGAARAFQAVKAGTYRADEHEPMLRGFPFARWSRAERDLAPPLVVEVDGADLRAEPVAEYLDGQARIVFIVRGPASPAPLVRLLSPGALVLQAGEVAALERLAGFAGPAVAALLPEPCAQFAHDPRGGQQLDARLSIAHLPQQAPRHALGWRSARQLADELGQLAALAELMKAAADVSVVVVPPPGGESPGVDGARAVDAVAAWMLAQSGFAGGGT